MAHIPLSMSRRHVLGGLYERCDALEDPIPVFLDADETDPIGHVDQSMGHYADAFTFHLADDICKKLSAGHFAYSFEFRPSDGSAESLRSRVNLISVRLISNKGYKKPTPRNPKRPVEETIET